MKRIIIILILLQIFKLSVGQEDNINGEYKIFNYPNGNIASEGYLLDNKPIGFWKSYYITGVKKSEGIWTNNKLDSIWIFYDQLGDTTEKINYYSGKKNGFFYKYFSSDQFKNKIAVTEMYINGKRNGVAKYYYGSGELKVIIPYNEDKKHGIGFEYDEKGKIITITRYRNGETVIQEIINRYNDKGQKDGIWKDLYSNGNLREEKTYLDGKLNGYVKRYNEEGKLVNSIKYSNGEVDLSAKDFDSNIEIKEEYDEKGMMIFQGSYKGENPVGIHRFFNNEGKVVKSETYDINGALMAEGVVLPNGWKNGSWIYYYEKGRKRATGKYINGKKVGKWTYYYRNGKVQQTGSYSTDKLSGIWKWYYKTGELLREEYYIYGKLDGECIEYSVLGNIISKGSFIEGNKEGKWIYVIGDQKMEGKYTLDLKDGVWLSYYLEKGTLSFRGKYLQGNPDGKHEYFFPDGTIKEEQYYSEGERVRSWSKYNERGELVIVVQYKNGTPYKINGVKVKLNQEEN